MYRFSPDTKFSVQIQYKWYFVSVQIITAALKGEF